MHKFTVRRRLSLALTAGVCFLNLLPAGAYAPPESPVRPVEGTLPAASSVRPAVCPIQDAAPDSDLAVPASYAVVPDAPPGSPAVQSTLAPPAAEPLQPESQPEETSAEADQADAQAAQKISALLAGCLLTDLQRSALQARLAADSQLLALLEQGELTDADLTCLALPNGRSDRLDRYSAWKERHPEDTLEEVVFQVNLDQDYAFYQNIQAASDQDSLTVLVNKHFALSADYVPVLETLGTLYGTGSLRPEAAAAFRAMADAARTDGISLRSVSAYRSYQYQLSLYNRYLAQDRQASVDTYSARPGHSEHQTGLALDINVASMKAGFEYTPAYAWLQEHCAEYGFMLRYPKGKEYITGYSFEPWHYRYVGTEIAKACMEQGLTYEEYLALQPETVFLPQADPEQ